MVGGKQVKLIKPNYSKKQCSFSSFLLTQGNNTGSKWQLTAQKASFMPYMHGTSLMSIPGQFGPITLGK